MNDVRAFPIDVWIERALRTAIFSAEEENDAHASCANSSETLFWRTWRLRAASICFIMRAYTEVRRPSLDSGDKNERQARRQPRRSQKTGACTAWRKLSAPHGLR